MQTPKMKIPRRLISNICERSAIRQTIKAHVHDRLGQLGAAEARPRERSAMPLDPFTGDI